MKIEDLTDEQFAKFMEFGNNHITMFEILAEARDRANKHHLWLAKHAKTFRKRAKNAKLALNEQMKFLENPYMLGKWVCERIIRLYGDELHDILEVPHEN